MIARDNLPHWGVFAFVSALCLSIAFTCFKLASDETSPFLYTTFYIGANFIAHIVYYRVIGRKSGQHILPKKMLLLALLTGALLVLGDASFFMMYKSGAPISLSTPLFSAGSVAVTVLFAVIFLREKITPRRIAGFVCTLLGIIMLNV